MKLVTKLKENENRIWALGLSVLLCAVISIFFDYYYALNDDVLIKDILAGVYTGIPDGRNIQMLYPISFLLSLLYRLVRGIPWYGIFMNLCHFGSVYLITERLLGFCKKRWAKAVTVFVEALVVIALLLQDLVYVQYTVTCTLLAAAATFCFYTSKADVSVKKFFCSNLWSVILVTIAYCVRSEMLLLVLPLICVTGLCKWACEKPFFTKENAAKYFSVLGAILAGIVLSQGIHMLAYSGEDWQQFNEYFDNRTELYDFQTIPPYEGNEAFYESIGMSENEQILLVNYNFGLDEEINAERLGEIAKYAAELKAGTVSFKDNLREAVINYKYRTFHATDYPWNMFVLVMYGVVLLTALCNKRFRFLWELICLGVVRTGLWMFILYRGRDPERITHSLYLMELVILFAFWVVECAKDKKMFTWIKAGSAVILTGMCFLGIGGSIEKVQSEYVLREEVNAELLALQQYTKENPENFYFVDVYSTVKYSEKLFGNIDNTISNYDIMGGWASKSPLTTKKLQYFGIDTMEQALLQKENVYMVVRGDEPAGMPAVQEWLPDYYAEKGIKIVLEKADIIYAENTEAFDVYSLKEIQ